MMQEVENNSTRGILHAAAGMEKFHLSRFKPSGLLEPFIEHYWVIHYQLELDTVYSQTVLSYPNVHLAFEEDSAGRRALLYGVPSRPFVRELRGSGRVLGIKFRAGGFYPFWQKDVSLLTGNIIPVSDVFGLDTELWMNAVLNADDGSTMARQTDLALSARLPERDTHAELAALAVEEAMRDRDIIKVEQLCQLTELSIRQLQRLFRKYVGVTPKWVIKRFRLQEAAERLEQDENVQLAELAAQLGYFDQAHFIKDFKSVLGQSPSAFRKSQA